MVIIYATGSALLFEEVLLGEQPLLRRRAELLFLLGLVPLELYCSFGHGLLLGGRLPFAPLMLTSAYCAAGVCYAWALQLRRYMQLAVAPLDSDRTLKKRL